MPKQEKYQNLIEKCSEITLFLIIDSLSYLQWRIDHDVADGRIKDGEHIDRDLKSLQEQSSLAVAQTRRFGVLRPQISG